MTQNNVKFGFEIEAKDKTRPLIQQVHGNGIAFVNRMLDHDRLLETPQEADALVASFTKVPIYVTTADCIPVLLYGDTGPIAAVHAGWRGVKNRVTEKVVNLLHGSTKNLIAVLGPSIQSCCFEIREDLIEAFRADGHAIEPFIDGRNNKLFFDLPRYLCETQLEGIPLVLDHHQCTYCSSPELPSYRRNKSTDPRIRAWIVRT